MILKDYSINIIMYHYVRPIKHSQYPKLKGLELKEFCNQIKFLKRKSNILSHNEIFEILKSKKNSKKAFSVFNFR